MRPFDLLNRWIMPLEGGRDRVTLCHGETLDVPFDQVVIFSTNIEPRELADEAFLNRLGCKIRIDPLAKAEYFAPFRSGCEERGMPFLPEAVRQMIEEEHTPRRIPLRPCHVIDVLDRVAEICRFEGRQPVLERDLPRRACRDYFA